jgi:hypothetical protein
MKADHVGKAIQCPTCGRKHPVGVLPDAPSFQCEGCGQRLKVPAQFRPSVMASSRHLRRPKPDARDGSTSVLPASAPAPARAAAPSAPRARARKRAPAIGATAPAGPQPVALPLRLLAWTAALILGLLVTGWIARVTGWLSGDRLVDVFTGTGGPERYLRVLVLAPAWAVATTLLLTLFLEGGRALARRRNEVRARGGRSPREERRTARRPVDSSVDDVARDRAGGDGQQFRRRAARRSGR